MPQDIETDVAINIAAGQTFKHHFTGATFNISDSMVTIKHTNGTGQVRVRIANAAGQAMENTFRITPLIPLVISFKPLEGDPDDVLVQTNSADFTWIEITPDHPLEGQFSWGKGYPRDIMNVVGGQRLD